MQSRRMLVVALVVGCSSHEAPPPLPRNVAPATTKPVVLHTHRVMVPERDPVAAWSLTASDGSGLKLVSVDAKAVVEGPLAFTELHLTFRNPEPRVREGTFSITLPARASVSRFAMIEDGKAKEAEVVAKALARRVYDDELHEGIDPAILEKAAGNEFTARVFPIPANASKELVISYSQELAGAGYLLPLKGFPKIDSVSVALDAARADGNHDHQVLHEVHWQPDHDFVANVDPPPAIASGPLHGVGDVEVAAAFEIDPEGKAAPDAPVALTLLVDTSASRAPGFRRYLDRVAKLVGELARSYPQLALDVTAFDQETRAVYGGPVAGFGDAEVSTLVARRAAGASDLGQAVKAVKHGQRIAIVTDGVITAGAEGAALAKAIADAAPARVDVILAGGIRDDKVAETLTRTGGRPGDVFDLDQPIEPITVGLGESVLVDVPVEVAGATWFSPHTIASVRPGTQVMVFAKLPAQPQDLAVTIGGVPRTAVLKPATPALIERAAARVEIEELDTRLAAATDAKATAALRKQIEQMSVAERVVSSQTAMLVLDSEEEYAHYGIDRNALVDILAVGPNGLELRHRTFVASKERHQSAIAARRDAIEMARSAGVLGMSGFGAGGGGSGWGTIGVGNYGTVGHGSGTGQGYGMGGGRGELRSRTVAVPTISIGAPSIAEGSLDKNFIRRYIRRNIEKITYCYERRLLAHPQLHGEIHTQFTINPDGHVANASATGFDDEVATCVADVLRQIEFPKVNGTGVIQVNYPFTFRTPETPAEPDPVQQAIDAPHIAAPPAASPTIASSPTPAAPPTHANVTTPSPRTPAASQPATASPPATASVTTTSPRTSTSPALTASPPPHVSPPAHASVTTTSPPTPASPPANASRPVDAVTSPAPEPTHLDPATLPFTSEGNTFGPRIDALRGNLAKVSAAISKRDAAGALALATKWSDDQPTDVLALVGLGEAYEANHDTTAAAREYGSIIDLYPTRAEYRRFAGERLERLGAATRALAIDSYRRAVADRPDQITGHRLLAYALVRADDYAGAFAAILAGADQKTPEGRFAGAAEVFARDAGMIGAAYLAHGGNRAAIMKALVKRQLELVTERSTRFILYWETDANDVDLHVRDRFGNHAYFAHKDLASGGALYADITTGYGPECFEIRGTPSAGPYDLGVHYYNQGPMGYGMGLLEIVRFDGRGFSFAERPYVIMKNQAFVALGKTP